ncbi:E3 ubiquitin- ligase [Lecanosticta acicola]|uniref:RBR-type E3 ubiquitin transferase n=1 Tax=Lecanosticta acicola TaxID=111012 RepID=A0AAI9ED97_9PEZI|nr:E3 ubiquitin- ligase [Lecanosticta acicola]
MTSTRYQTRTKRECEICATEKPANRFPLLPPTKACQHSITICTECVQTWISTCIDTNYNSAIQCPYGGCDEEVSRQKDMPDAATTHQRSRYSHIAHRIVQSRVPRWRWCLAPDCDEGQLHEPLEPPTLEEEDVCVCDGCGAEACVLCDRPYHDAETCEEYAARNLPSLVAQWLSEKVIGAQKASGRIRDSLPSLSM